MRCRVSRAFVAGAGLLVAATAARAQEPPSLQMMQLQVQRIAQERPPEAEGVAREFLRVIASDRVAGLDSLKARSLDMYWMEIGQMFGTEAQARALQRDYHDATEPQRQAIRGRLEATITRHFEFEDQLRGLEIADIERRLVEVRAESERRRQKRAELVRWAVDDIVRDALRPN